MFEVYDTLTLSDIWDHNVGICWGPRSAAESFGHSGFRLGACMYSGLKGMTIEPLWGLGIYYSGTWTLWDRAFRF